MAVALGIENDDGTVNGIYVYSDGMTELAWQTAASRYSTVSAVQKLIALGNLSWIGKSIGKPVDFNEAQRSWVYDVPSQCLAYTRDRGEPWDRNRPATFDGRNEFTQAEFCGGIAWRCLFDRKAGRWLIHSHRGWEPVTLHCVACEWSNARVE